MIYLELGNLFPHTPTKTATAPATATTTTTKQTKSQQQEQEQQSFARERERDRKSILKIKGAMYENLNKTYLKNLFCVGVAARAVFFSISEHAVA